MHLVAGGDAIMCESTQHNTTHTRDTMPTIAAVPVRNGLGSKYQSLSLRSTRSFKLAIQGKGSMCSTDSCPLLECNGILLCK